MYVEWRGQGWEKSRDAELETQTRGRQRNMYYPGHQNWILEERLPQLTDDTKKFLQRAKILYPRRLCYRTRVFKCKQWDTPPTYTAKKGFLRNFPLMFPRLSRSSVIQRKPLPACSLTQSVTPIIPIHKRQSWLLAQLQDCSLLLTLGNDRDVSW